MKFVSAILLFLGFTVSQAATCFETHIREAIQINKERMALYGAQTNGRSLWLSKAWIASEEALLLSLPLFNPDKIAADFEAAGIPVVCSGFIEMKETPAFNPTLSVESIPPFINLHFEKNLFGKISKLLKKDLIVQAWHVLDVEIKKIEIQPQYHCLSRHILESSARFLGQAEFLNKQALAKGLPSSKSLSIKLAMWQLIGLPLARTMDFHARKIHSEGVPIFCNDVPPVPYPYLH